MVGKWWQLGRPSETIVCVLWLKTVIQWSPLLFWDQRKIMECWTCDSFLLISQVFLLCYNKLFNADNVKLTSNPTRLALDFLSLSLIFRGRSWFQVSHLIPFQQKPVDHRILPQLSFTVVSLVQILCFQLSASHITLLPSRNKINYGS